MCRDVKTLKKLSSVILFHPFFPMHIQLIGDHFNLSEKTRQLINDKFIRPAEKLLTHFNEDMKSAFLKIKKIERRGEFEVHFDMWLPGKEHIYAKTSASSLIASIVELRKKVDRQIESYKGKLNRSKKSIKEVFGFWENTSP